MEGAADNMQSPYMPTAVKALLTRMHASSASSLSRDSSHMGDSGQKRRRAHCAQAGRVRERENWRGWEGGRERERERERRRRRRRRRKEDRERERERERVSE